MCCHCCRPTCENGRLCKQRCEIRRAAQAQLERDSAAMVQRRQCVEHDGEREVTKTLSNIFWPSRLSWRSSACSKRSVVRGEEYAKPTLIFIERKRCHRSRLMSMLRRPDSTVMEAHGHIAVDNWVRRLPTTAGPFPPETMPSWFCTRLW